MNAAAIERSERLQRVLVLLSDGLEHSTLDIALSARVCAVNSAVAEIRQQGYNITCTRRGGVWYYKLER